MRYREHRKWLKHSGEWGRERIGKMMIGSHEVEIFDKEHSSYRPKWVNYRFGRGNLQSVKPIRRFGFQTGWKYTLSDGSEFQHGEVREMPTLESRLNIRQLLPFFREQQTKLRDDAQASLNRATHNQDYKMASYYQEDVKRYQSDLDDLDDLADDVEKLSWQLEENFDYDQQETYSQYSRGLLESTYSYLRLLNVYEMAAMQILIKRTQQKNSRHRDTLYSRDIVYDVWSWGGSYETDSFWLNQIVEAIEREQAAKDQLVAAEKA